MITCTRLLQWDGGHRVMGHEGKCAHMHGHRWTAELTAASDGLDKVGRVIDFGVLKSLVGTWIDDHFDHGFIVYESDVHVRRALESIQGQKIYVLPTNPTSENIAAYLLNIICPHLLTDTGVTVERVRVWETPNCYATATKKNEEGTLWSATSQQSRGGLK